MNRVPWITPCLFFSSQRTLCRVLGVMPRKRLAMHLVHQHHCKPLACRFQCIKTKSAPEDTRIDESGIFCRTASCKGCSRGPNAGVRQIWHLRSSLMALSASAYQYNTTVAKIISGRFAPSPSQILSWGKTGWRRPTRTSIGRRASSRSTTHQHHGR